MHVPQPPTRFLVGNAPRAYREALGFALRARRPDIDVVIVDPKAVDAAVVSLYPVFVVCSALTEVIETRVPAWVLLYPDGARLAVSSVAGERTQTSNLDFDALLTLADRAEYPAPA